MTLVTSGLYKVYRRIKAALDYGLDRIVELCNLVLTDYYYVRRAATRRAARRLATGVGDACSFLRSLPRVPAYRLSGADWKIVFVGSDNGRQEICHRLLGDGADQQALGRFSLWRLGRHTRDWLDGDADMVVYESSRFRPWTPHAPVAFTVPCWIQMELAVPERLEALTADRGFRSRIPRAQKAGFLYHFTQAADDFEYFYEAMYLPFVRERHANLALVMPYADLLRWFRRGGLLLVTRGDQRLAGSVCYTAGDTCHLMEQGVLGADPHIWQQGINAFLFWASTCWAHEQGARIINMGGTRPLRSDGSLNKKQRWGARPARRNCICPEWTFLARELPPALQDHINRLGFLTSVGGRYYGVFLSAGSPAVNDAIIQQETLTARREGLDGLAVVSPGGQLKTYS